MPGSPTAHVSASPAYAPTQFSFSPSHAAPSYRPQPPPSYGPSSPSSGFHAPTAPAPTDACAGSPKVCIFDIDNTLTVGAHHNCPLPPGSAQPAWPDGSGATDSVRAAVRACRDAGFQIGVASAESRSEETNAKQLAFLKSLDPTPDAPSVFTDAFFGSPAFQGAWTVLADADQNREFLPNFGGNVGAKQAMFLNILKHYDVPMACYGKSAVFDDQTENLCAAHSLGLKSFQASPECGGVYCDYGCGITAATVQAIPKI